MIIGQIPPMFPEFSSFQNRLDSFVRWPLEVVGLITPASLAASGFFYIGPSDKVCCYQCGIAIWKWDPENDPATEHNIFSPECPASLLPLEWNVRIGSRQMQTPSRSLATQPPGVASTVHQEEAAEMVVAALGHSPLRMRRVLERRRRQGRAFFNDLTSLTTAIMEEAERRAAAAERASELAAAVAGLGVQLSVQPCLMDALQDLEVPPSRAVLGINECQRCHRRASILLYPCHHMPFCPPCSIRPRTCPICDGQIRATAGIDIY